MPDAPAKPSEPPRPAIPLRDHTGKFQKGSKAPAMAKRPCANGCGAFIDPRTQRWHDRVCPKKNPSKGTGGPQDARPPPAQPFRFVLTPEAAKGTPEGVAATSGAGGAADGGSTPPPKPQGADTGLIAQAMDGQTFWPSIADAVNGAIKHDEYKIRLTPAQCTALHNAFIAAFPRILANPVAVFAIILGITFGLPVVRDWNATRKETAELERHAAKQREALRGTPDETQARPAAGGATA